MRDKLVCYLLDELDDQGRTQLEARLANEPALRRELEQIRECLEDSTGSSDCPEGLAVRTADNIARLSHDGLLTGADAPCDRSRWTMVDIGVAAGVVLAVGMMVLPALPRSREETRRVMCADNMRQVGQALQGYASRHEKHFPLIFPEENAGMFAVRLVESGEMPRQELARLLWCRAASLQDGSAKITIRIPKTEELNKARGQALAALRRWMAGSYAYRLGYVEDGAYYAINNKESAYSPIMSDAPVLTSRGWVSNIHGDNRQNVLFQDGGVRVYKGPTCRSMDSDLFVNRSGHAAAGNDADDVVLVRSEMTPGVAPSIRVVAPAILRPNGDQQFAMPAAH